ncbi:MarR family winged helix-turn-helix transcriptional regulator [Dongia sp.]|uniref:MarR family winged helix-turn-helix transcriptional regulator n=1 Tax=Dongia sp. TaxID=1977262 RepID=UPI00375153C6
MVKAADLDLDRFLPYRLDILAEAVSRALSRIYKEEYGLAVPEWRVLAHLGQYAPITAKAIVAHSRMHKTKVSRAVAELERIGFVRRGDSDEDRREEPLVLTAKGKAAYDDLAPKAAEFARHLLDDLSAAERKTLENAIDRLLAKLVR